MRYHYEQSNIVTYMYGELYFCNHVIYGRCTLFRIGDKGLAVIQQRYDNKKTYWTEIDSWLVDKLYLHPGFKQYFDKYASESKNDIFPTVTIRQIMWGLRMKPLKREPWETYFDHSPI